MHLCKIEGCEEIVISDGLCDKHLHRYLMHGDPVKCLVRSQNVLLEDEFWGDVDVKSENECWIWRPGKNRQGYGKICIARQEYRAHRVAWELKFGKIPDGMLVLHKCDNPSCVNPGHLFLGNHQDNTNDCISKGRFRSRYIKRSLSLEKAEEARRLYLSGKFKQRELAERFGVTFHHMHLILRGRYWRS
jgi:hypothetical protein